MGCQLGCTSRSDRQLGNLVVTENLELLQGEWALRENDWAIVGTISGTTVIWPDNSESELIVRERALSLTLQGVKYTASVLDRGVHWRGIRWSDGHVWVPLQSRLTKSAGRKIDKKRKW